MPRIASKIGATLKGNNLFPLRAAPMVKKQSILCKWNFIINIFPAHVTHKRNVRNKRYAYARKIKNCLFLHENNSYEYPKYMLTWRNTKNYLKREHGLDEKGMLPELSILQNI